ncbi:hypothetical protein [Sporosalibacterium faouarense]|uniref:hypothetical protein n=1 Tax=Sporosalibacterium faouarense TaxID=516123 RepID=UPI00141C4BF3|nr:hypothetical protein [Sporosalibacterium faouarense]MTI47421.1 hypothetical protein [Bacillota bacterium]
MPGRVNDFGQFRVEKELDACPWDIVGSEFCRCTTSSLEGTGVAFGGPSMEYNMVEAKGCGDLHCRVIAENRDKYPMPEKESWEKFGPIATSDQIKFTPEDKMYKEPQQFRQECDFKYRNGLNAEITHDQLYGGLAHPLGSDMVLNVLYPMIEAKEINKEEIENVIKCVFEASGKMTFGEHFAIKGLRDWLGVPGDVKDGRVLGGYIEVVLQALRAKYDIQNFDKEEVIYDINLAGLERRHPMLTKAYLSMWNGMGKTLIGSQWFVWRETEGVADEILRLKIGKKIDKFC